jgi:YHS domain-containing protein
VRFLGIANAAALYLIAHSIPSYCQQTRQDGFWKCHTGSIKGEFNGEDVIGLSAGAHIPTDCALYVSIGHGKTYCFSSRPSLEEFEANSADYIARAQSFWNRSQVATRPAQP